MPLRILNVNPTYRCTSRCTHCRYFSSPDCEIHYMTPDLLLSCLTDILENYSPEEHPIIGPLLSGGSAGLLSLACFMGYEPVSKYIDPCQLCFETRRFLRSRFPDFLTPGVCY